MNFKPMHRDQRELFPSTLDELVPADHLVRIIGEYLSEFDLGDFNSAYHHLGQRAYPPQVLLGILLYGMAKGVRSSRKLAALCAEDIPTRWLCGGLNPDFRTISDFRKRHREAICGLLAQVVAMAREMGVVKLSLWSIDGTIIKANANTGKAQRQASLEKELESLESGIREAMIRVEKNDEKDDDDFGSDDSGDGIPPELRAKEGRAARIREALKRVKESKTKIAASATDPEAPIIKRRGKPSQCSYNAQITVDTESGMIVAAEVVAASADTHQLLPQTEQAIANVGEAPEAVVADAGHISGRNLSKLSEQEITPYLPAMKGDSNFGRDPDYRREAFTYNKEADCFVCPEGKVVGRVGRKRAGDAFRVVYICKECEGCPAASRCLKPGAKRRSIAVNEYDAALEAHRRRAKGEAARSAARRRKSTVEPTFGILKEAFGLRQFLTRGLARVNAEFALAALAFNLRKLAGRL